MDQKIRSSTLLEGYISLYRTPAILLQVSLEIKKIPWQYNKKPTACTSVCFYFKGHIVITRITLGDLQCTEIREYKNMFDKNAGWRPSKNLWIKKTEKKYIADFLNN